MKILNFIIFFTCLAWGFSLALAQGQQEDAAFLNCLNEVDIRVEGKI